MHLMLDTETLSTDPRAVVLSIGAVLFDETTVHRMFYREVEVDPQLRGGRHVMASTLSWWVEQSDAAKRVFSDAEHKQPLVTVLQELNLFVGSEAPTVLAWANGAGFDLPILTTAYNDAGLPAPWRFHNERCFRTMKNLYPQVRGERRGVGHNALDDARNQAAQLVEILKCSAPS